MHARILFLAIVTALVGGCQTVPPAPENVPAPSRHRDPPPAPAQPAEQTSPPVPSTPQQKQQAQAIALAAATLLESGNEEQALTQLQRALALDAGHKLAMSLKRQISDDPMAMLGRESFVYVVRPNETISTIALRFLNDVYLFYALARYNNIAVPRQLSAGQTIKIPGKAPPRIDPPLPPPAAVAVAPSPAPAPPPVQPPAPPPLTPGEIAMRDGEAAERAKDLERALVLYRKAVTVGHATAQGKADRVAHALVAGYSQAAHRAFLAQDLEGAINGWTQALRIDPGNEKAKLELQRSKELKKKADDLPK